eukprot:4375595-Ditylum_brightwellii.AAC.1
MTAPFIPEQSNQAVHVTQERRQKLRVGFISSLFGGDAPHVGIGSKKPSRDFVDATAEYFHVGYYDELAREVLISQKLDCLVFAEMQNEAIAHFLGYYRFAPIQILVMGAP